MPRSASFARTDCQALCEIRGRVQEGNKIGRTIGFPTANIAMAEDSALPHGIYVSLIRLDGGYWRDSISYVGRRPTVNGTTLLLETHIFDFDQTIYGASATVELLEHIRGDAIFDDLDGMKAQIAKDCALARRRLGALDGLASVAAYRPTPQSASLGPRRAAAPVMAA